MYYLSIKGNKDIHKLNMRKFSNIVVIGGVKENPAHFETEIGPVKLDKDYEVCLASICHGQIYNIHDGNNKVYFYHGNRLDIERIKQIRGKVQIIRNSVIEDRPEELYNPSSLASISIPKGTYNSSLTVIRIIANLMMDNIDISRKRVPMNPTLDKQSKNIRIELNSVYLIVEGKKDTPWSLLNVREDKYETFVIEDLDLHSKQVPGMVYTNIIENSYVNGKLFRNLSIIPMSYKAGWTFYKPTDPFYTPISVREFTKIVIALKDINNEYIKFDPMFKTIITLHIKPIKGV